jgi:hypothetical protein
MRSPSTAQSKSSRSFRSFLDSTTSVHALSIRAASFSSARGHPHEHLPPWHGGQPLSTYGGKLIHLLMRDNELFS